MVILFRPYFLPEHGITLPPTGFKFRNALPVSVSWCTTFPGYYTAISWTFYCINAKEHTWICSRLSPSSTLLWRMTTLPRETLTKKKVWRLWTNENAPYLRHHRRSWCLAMWPLVLAQFFNNYLAELLDEYGLCNTLVTQQAWTFRGVYTAVAFREAAHWLVATAKQESFRPYLLHVLDEHHVHFFLYFQNFFEAYNGLSDFELQ